MQLNLQKTIYMLSKYFLYGFIVQMMVFNFVLAIEVNGQYKSIDKVQVKIDRELISLIQLFKSIEKQTPFNFLYDHKQIDSETVIILTEHSGSVESFLRQVSIQSNLRFRQVNNGIDVKENPRLPYVTISEHGEFAEVKGTIVDESGYPLPGVTVIVQGTTQGTISDVDGKFSIGVPDGGTLVFSFIGYEEQTVAVGNQSELTITMAENLSDLEEVIVVGYGTQTMREVTGAISQVKSESLEKVASSNFTHALQGQMAGVNVTASSGAPGAPANIKIRGVGSFSAEAIGPLYVVDGVPFDQTPNFSTNEIESIEVLKDAASASIYGTRASNGVILITTKQGKAGEMKVSLDSYYGITNIRRSIPLINNTLDWLFTNRVRYASVGEIATGWTALIDNPRGLYHNTNWMDLFQVDNAPIQNHSIRLSGGQENLTYSVVTSYFGQDGLWLNSEYERLSTRANAQFTKGKFSANVGLALAHDTRSNHNPSLPFDAIRLRPFKAPIDYTLEEIPAPGSNAAAIANIASRVKEVNEQKSNDLFFNLGLNYELFEGFKIRANIGADATNSIATLFNPSFNLINESTGAIVAGGQPIAALQNTLSYRQHWISELMGTYEKMIGEHKFTLLAAISREQSIRETFIAGKRGFLSNDIRVLGGGAIDPVSDGFKYVNSLSGSLGRLQYNYADRYMFSASVRRDGSSRFSADNRFGFFPSISAGWNIAEEQFFRNSKLGSLMSSAKLRASYGTAGNQFISDYLYAAVVSSGIDYVLGPTDQALALGVTQQGFANNDVKWETSITKNIGLDLMFLDDQISFTADAYVTNKSDMLFPIRIPPSAGAGGTGSVIMNIGDMYNKGYELSGSYRKFNGDFNYTFTTVFTQNVNRVTKTNLESSIIYGGSGGTDPMTVIREGYPVGSFFLIPTEGIISTQEELATYREVVSDAMLGDLKYTDVNGDDQINDDDRVYAGDGNPKWTIGFTFSPSYRNFDLMLQLYGSYGNQIYNVIKSNAYAHKRHVDVLNAWNPSNTTSTIPTPRGSLSHANYRSRSDYYLEDGSFLRVRNVQLGYTIPASFLDRISISSGRVYLGVENPITFTRYSGNDPEIGNDGLLNQGVDSGNIPVTSNYRLGLQVSF
ncbi:SusC/RagA family TonB-linked outer membrane protein [Algoriphagus sp.]|uniref:SusC/RagA family TonB-linked outer membrane protein n=1 Tax=Algoriphagus sp. TaxID=1872435 RepID=UPI003F70020A